MRKLMMGVFALCVSSSPALAEKLNNQMVVELVKAGLGDEAIVAKISGSEGAFDLSTDHLIDLKRQGVSSPVIAAMIRADSSPARAGSGPVKFVNDSPEPLVPHASGIYLLMNHNGPAHMLKIDPTVSNQTKTGGFFGYALTGGIASLSMKSVLPDPTARVRASGSRPVFYFYFDEANPRNAENGASGVWLSGPAATVTSPNEFSLVRFSQKKNAREARVGSFNIAGAKAGVMDKDRIPFAYDKLAPGVFKVFPQQDLQPGEYGFLYFMGGGGGVGMQAAASTTRVFDFSVLK